MNVTSDSAPGMREFHQWHPNLVIAALRLPSIEGEEFCAVLRRESDVPIVIIAERQEESMMVRMLELGTDAYLYPINAKELIARVHSLLCRYEHYRPKQGNLSFDSELCRVKLGEDIFQLTPTEFRLFSCLVLNEGRVVSKSQLSKEVWGRLVSEKTLHLYVCRLK